MTESLPFRLLLRVRYGECDAQGIVFNARWGDYIDTAIAEYSRVLFGGVDAAATGIDWRLVKQMTEWHAPARFDDVLDIRVRTLRVGTTSFALATEFLRHAEKTRLVSGETVCVMVQPVTGIKMPVPPAARAALERGASGIVVDHAAAVR